jgi:hypothetical protein
MTMAAMEAPTTRTIEEEDMVSNLRGLCVVDGQVVGKASLISP